MLFSRHKGRYVAIGIWLACSFVSAAEDWHAYEGTLHQSSSKIDVDPATLRLKWAKRFDQLTPITSNWPSEGTMHSRNLTLYKSNIGLVSSLSSNMPVNRATVLVLDAGNGNVRNWLKTNQREGPYKNQDDASDTSLGEQVLAWDSDTGKFFLSIGGDRPSYHAIDPLANVGSYAGPSQTAKGAYEDLNAQWPDIRSSRTQFQENWSEATNPRLKRSECPDSGTDDPPQLPDQYPSGGSSPANKAGFLEIQPGSNYLVNDRNHSHYGSSPIDLSNKRTGLIASRDWYQSNKTDLGWDPFKMWGGKVCDKDLVYCMGAYSLSNTLGGPVSAHSNGKYKGVRLSCVKYVAQNLGTNDGGYTGPGMNETAVKDQVIFDYTLNSTDLGNSWWETDDTYRNKTLLVENDNLWAAWKPGLNDPVQLVRANAAGITTYNLSVGSNMRGWDIWPNLAYSKVGTTDYLVYALFNAKTSFIGQPAGPATITVFNATTGAETWSFQLNNAAGTGNYPDLRPNSYELYCENARMVVAGKYAHVAWVDTASGPNLKLKVVSFDITSPTAPSTPPIPFVYDLGVARNASGGSANLHTRVPDMMAADGVLYVLIHESPDLLRPGHVHAQQVIALTSDAANPVLTSIGVMPASTTLLSGNTQQFVATAKDQFGNTVNPQPSITWSFSGSSGSGNITSSGLFTAGSTEGGPFTIVASSGGKSGTASVSVQSAFNVTFQEGVDGYAGTSDTHVNEYQATTAYGGAVRMDVFFAPTTATTPENIQGLLKFDLSSVPTNAQIASAAIKLYVTRVREVDPTIDFLLMKKVTSSWTENSTWTTRPSIVDSGVNPPALTVTATNEYVITGIKDLVQGWASDPSSNHGVLFYATNKLNYSFAASEIGTTAYRPSIQISYTLPGSNPDSDGDGLLDSWENQYFGSLSQSALDDPDSDGMNNELEYSSGTNPTDRFSNLAIISQSFTNHDLYVQWKSVVGKIYRIEATTNCVLWFPKSGIDLANPPPDWSNYSNWVSVVTSSAPVCTWVDVGVGHPNYLSSIPKRFYRIKLVEP